MSICLVIALLECQTSLAAAPTTNHCSIEEATGHALFDAMSRQARSSEVLGPILDEQLRIIGTVKQGDNRPLKDSLSPQDATRFEVLREKMLPIRLSQSTESGHDRDVQAISAMSSAAWKSYKDPLDDRFDKTLARFASCTEEERQSQRCRFISMRQLGDAVFALRVVFPRPDVALPAIEPVPCDINYALVRQQIDAVSTSTPLIDSFNKNDYPVLTRLITKYGAEADGRIKRDNINGEDRHTLQMIEAHMNSVQRSAQLVYDTRNIRLFWSASEMVYQSRLEDLQTYGSDEKSMGRTLQRKLSDAGAQTTMIIGFWKLVDALVPSEEDKMNKVIVNDLERYKVAPR
jgi:hypothetical protein